MPNRATVIGVAIVLAVAVVAALLGRLAIGPTASRAGLGNPSISIDDLHRQVDPSKLPVHSAPDP